MNATWKFFAVAGLLIVTPVFAQGPETGSDQAKAEIERETAYWNLQKARDEARQAAVTGRLAPLQGLAGEGRTTLGDNAAQMEAAYLASLAIREAARRIHADVRAHDTNPVILVEGEDALSFESLAIFEAEARGIARGFQRALGESLAQSCPDPGSRNEAAFGPASIIPIIGAVGSLLRTDTEIRGLDQLGSERMLAIALTSQQNSSYIRYQAILHPGGGQPGTADAMLSTLEGCRNSATQELARLSRVQSNPPNPRKALLEAIIERYDAFYSGLTAPGANGTVRLATIVRESALRDSGRNVLRVYVDRAGGTLITRRNIWTALGAPAIATTGGVIASYELTNPTTGVTLASGIIVCNSDLTGIRSAQRLTSRTPNCDRP